MATNNLIFKGIQQVRALPSTPEKGVIYFVREFNGEKPTGNAKVYFGSRLYGEVNKTKLAELQAAINANATGITANANAIKVINEKLGEWTESLGTVANAVVANQTAINNLSTATIKNIADAKTEAINTATGYTSTQINNVNKTLTAYTATTNTTLTGLRTDINTVSGATKTNASNIQALSGIVTSNETATIEAIADAKTEAINTATGYTNTQIEEVKGLINNKNVEATGDTYVSATASGNIVTVAATKKTTDAIALAETALQKNDIATGTANGTIKVDGTDVAVKGLGSAAYTNSSAYDASGAAATVKTELLGDAAEGYNTLGKLEDKIQAVAAAAKTYEIKAITTGLNANVKEAYGLFDEDGVQTGATINIYKDSSLKEVKLSGQTLQFTYILTDGSESTVGVDVSAFLSESEFGNGLQVVDHKVSVKKDASSEAFLSVSADGIKLSGVQQAINNAVENKNVSATGDTYVNATASGNKVTVTASDSTKASLALADSAVQTIATGTANGTIKVDGTDVAVKGLGSAAYTDASAYATAAQGTKADNAATKTDFNEHSGNTVMHITVAERSAWNAKLDTTAHTAYTAATKTTLDSIENRLTSITNDAVTSVAAADGETAITVAGEQAVTIGLNVSASEGNMIVKNADGIFAALYYGGDDVEV